jgi:hypothetical protein
MVSDGNDNRVNYSSFRICMECNAATHAYNVGHLDLKHVYCTINYTHVGIYIDAKLTGNQPSGYNISPYRYALSPDSALESDSGAILMHSTYILLQTH